jgi:hypothetical protein
MTSRGLSNEPPLCSGKSSGLAEELYEPSPHRAMENKPPVTHVDRSPARSPQRPVYTRGQASKPVERGRQPNKVELQAMIVTQN